MRSGRRVAGHTLAIRAAAGITVVALATLGSACSRPADSSAMSQGQAAAMLHELQEIRRLLESQETGAAARPPAVQPQRQAGVTGTGHVLGDEQAPLTLVEFTDYQCPFCSRFASTTFLELKKAYIDTGQVRFVSRDLPLPIHGDAEMAARAARCAGDEGRYWEMRDAMFSNQAQLGRNSLTVRAREIGLSGEKFEACLDGDRHLADVRRDAAEASAAGISGTPSFVLGRANGDRVDGAVIVGAQPFATFDAQIKTLLAEGRR